MRIALAVAALAVASFAYAGQHQPQPNPSAVAFAGAHAGATSSADVTVPITVSPDASASSDNSVTITNPRNAPSLGQGSIIPSGCGVGGNAGGSNSHGAAFLGWSWTPDNCYLLMLGDKFASIGMPDTACDLWMQMSVAEAAFKKLGRRPDCTMKRVEVVEQVPLNESQTLVAAAPVRSVDDWRREIDARNAERRNPATFCGLLEKAKPAHRKPKPQCQAPSK